MIRYHGEVGRRLFLALGIVTLVLGAAAAAPPLPEMLVSERTSRALGAHEGDVVELSRAAAGPWLRVHVAGILRVVDHPAELARRELLVRLHLPVLEALIGRPDAVDRVVIRAASAPRVTDALNAVGFGYRAYVAADLAASASEALRVVERFQRAIGIVTIAAAAVFLLTIMTLKGQQMRREVGLLRLVGISRATVVWTFLLVALAVALVGSVLGIGLALAGSAIVNAYYQRLFATAMVFSLITPGIVALAAALALPLGVLAGGAVALRMLQQHALDQVGRS